MRFEAGNQAKVLLVSPHADDMELGAGATVAKLIEEGLEVYSVVLSLRKKTVPPDFPEAELIRETEAAAKTLGIDRTRLHILDFPNREFPALRQEILDRLVQFRRELMPDVVFAPSFDDMHQDHLVTAHEVFRAFKNVSVLSYELPWNYRARTTQNFFSIVREAHLERKIEALSHYRSQAVRRVFFSADYVRSLAAVHGAHVNRSLAEAFEVVRWVAE